MTWRALPTTSEDLYDSSGKVVLSLYPEWTRDNSRTQVWVWWLPDQYKMEALHGVNWGWDHDKEQARMQGLTALKKVAVVVSDHADRYMDFKRGWIVGASGLPTLSQVGTQPPKHPQEFEDGYEQGTRAFVETMKAWDRRNGPVPAAPESVPSSSRNDEVPRRPTKEAIMREGETDEERRQRRSDALRALQEHAALKEACRLLRAHVPLWKGSPVATFLAKYVPF